MKNRWAFGLGFVIGVVATTLYIDGRGKKAYVASVTAGDGDERIAGIFSNLEIAKRCGKEFGDRYFPGNYRLQVYEYNVDNPSEEYHPQNRYEDGSDKAVITQNDFVVLH